MAGSAHADAAPIANPIYPPRLRRGDKVAIVAPAGAAPAEDTLGKAAERVRDLGLEPVIGPSAAKAWGYLAGTDEERAADLNWALRSPDIRGVFTLRGGYGVTRILPEIESGALRADPKVVTGFSDITALINFLTARSGIITFHGPTASSSLTGFQRDWFAKACLDGGSISEFANPSVENGRLPSPALRSVQSGKARGRLAGGNLALVAALLGTPFAIDFKDKLLFLEDVNEPPYRIDRMLCQLWLAGALDQISGLIIGDLREPRPTAEPPVEPPQEPAKAFTMDEVLDNLRKWTKVPIFCGFPAGHLAQQVTIPIGAMGEIDADRQTLRLV